MENTDYMEHLINSFHSIGIDPQGGVTRLGYTDVEDEMHQQFIVLSQELGLDHVIDEVGNTFVGDITSKEYILIGSHLDSPNEGGRYDGVAGIMAGLQIAYWMKKDGWRIPFRIGAFRCEESSNFGIATLGSSFVTGTIPPESIKDLAAQNEDTLEEIFKKRGYLLNPKLIEGVLEYLELHIEQSRVLETYNDDIGIVSTITAATRFSLDLYGQADHSGGTPMELRRDALCVAAEIILATEQLGREEKEHGSVATVGVLHNQPNVINAISGHVLIKVDIRGIESDSIARLVSKFQDQVKDICGRREIDFNLKLLSHGEPVSLSPRLQDSLYKSAQKLGYQVRKMPSGAGHDAMNFPGLCETGMVFIPCKNGISHSKEEFTTPLEIVRGAGVLYQHLKEILVRNKRSDKTHFETGLTGKKGY